MSLVDHLFTNRTPMELAKELARSAHENAALRDKLGAAELELFWMKAAEREPVAQASAAPADAPEPACHCEACYPNTWENQRMVVCATCGNKRCPHATDHRNACTNSNEPGQPGSSYPARLAATQSNKGE